MPSLAKARFQAAVVVTPPLATVRSKSVRLIRIPWNSKMPSTVTSSGANVYAAVELARTLRADQRVVTVLCDSGERYF